MKRKNLWRSIPGIAYGLLLLAFTTYVLLDTFVIARVYSAVPAPAPGQVSDTNGDNAPSAGSAPDSSADDPGTGTDIAQTLPGTFTENSYTDDDISIVLTDYKEYETNIHVAEVTVSSPTYLKTAFAYGLFGQNIKAETSETASRAKAIFAINGDYYGAREKGYVLRNGLLYRSESNSEEDLVIYKDGSFAMISEDKVTAEALLANGAQQVLSFGPPLVKNGVIAVSDRSKVHNPRTAIGQIDELHYLFVVTDGRLKDSQGLTFHELAEFMLSLGATEAYNLDGGGSSAMYFNGVTINKMPKGEERKVSDIVYIGY